MHLVDVAVLGGSNDECLAIAAALEQSSGTSAGDGAGPGRKLPLAGDGCRCRAGAGDRGDDRRAELTAWASGLCLGARQPAPPGSAAAWLDSGDTVVAPMTPPGCLALGIGDGSGPESTALA